jgi:hypothetical protein
METKKIIDFVVISDHVKNDDKNLNANENYYLISEKKSLINNEKNNLEVCQYVLNIINEILIYNNTLKFIHNKHILDDNEKIRFEYLLDRLTSYNYFHNPKRIISDDGYYTPEQFEQIKIYKETLEIIIDKTENKIEILSNQIESLQQEIEHFDKINPNINLSNKFSPFIIQINDYLEKGYVLHGGYIKNGFNGYQAMIKYED